MLINKRNYVVFSIAWFIASCTHNDISKVNKVANLKDVNAETVLGVETMYSTDGHVKAKLKAPKLIAIEGKDPHKELPDGLEVLFYNAEMQEDGRLQARYGITYDNKHKVFVKNNVVVINTKGDKLLTEELTWDINNHKIYTDKAVTIITEKEKIFGQGMEAREDFTNYKIKKISGTVKVKQTTFE